MAIERVPLVVVGAGITGLAVASGLQKIGHPVVVLERDAHMSSRHPGYSLTMQAGTSALKLLGIEEKRLRELSVGTLSHYVTLDKDGTVLKSQPSSATGKDHFVIPRQVLREELYQGLEKGTVRWGYELIDLVEYHDQVLLMVKCRATGDHLKIAANFVLLCEGVHSKVLHRVLPDKTPLQYLGVSAIMGLTPRKWLPEGKSFSSEFHVLDGKTRLFVKPYSPTQIMWQVTIKKEESKPYYFSPTPGYIRENLRKAISLWEPKFKQLLENLDPSSLRMVPLYDKIPQTLPEESRLTLLGDAAHPMSPFKGQGANQGLIDALVLTAEFMDLQVDNTPSVLRAFRNYEHNMIARTTPYVRASRVNVEKYHSERYLRECRSYQNTLDLPSKL